MANWAYVENNEIVDTFDSLPKNWKNISNLDASEGNQDFLKSVGWYPIEKNLVSCDINTQNFIEGPIVFDGKKVSQTNIVENKSTQELYSNFMTLLRNQRDTLLKESDYMCLMDIVLTRGDTWLTDVAEYRKKLRDLPNSYSNDGTIYSIFDVVWPVKPNINDYPILQLNTNILNQN